MSWDKIIGHGENCERLKNMLNGGRTAHAVLFAGPEGIGKSLVARTTAAGLLCHSEGDKPCGMCLACIKMAENVHPDFFLIQPEGNHLKIGQVRGIQNEAVYAPRLGSCKVVVLEDGERMTKDAANCLLKILEEPPAYLYFIMVGASEHQFLPTILSRCRIFRFSVLCEEELAGYLVKQGYSGEIAKTAAKLSGGKIGEALRLAVPGGLLTRDCAAKVLIRLPEENAEWVWQLVSQAEYEDVEKIVGYYACILRDMMVLKHKAGEYLLYNDDIREAVLYSLADQWNIENIMSAMEKVRETEQVLKTNANSKLAHEALLIRLMDVIGRN